MFFSLTVFFVISVVKANIFNVINTTGYFYAPYTPFNNDATDPYTPGTPTINEAAIQNVVDTAIYYGVNIFWLGGSNGQFDTMSVDERKQVCNAFMAAISNSGARVYSIFNVAATRIDESVELARFANEECGVDAVGSLPPYYNRVSTSDNFNQLFTWFRPIINASNNMPFWYYHYPGRTSYNINIQTLLTEAITNGALTQLEGIKFNHNNVNDLYGSTGDFGDTIAIIPYYFPILGIMSLDKQFGYGTTDYLAPVIKCIRLAVQEQRIDDAYAYQNWMISMGSLAPWPVGDRCVYQNLPPSSFSFGPPRPPVLPYSQQQCDDVIADLTQADFFNQLEQITTDTTCTQIPTSL